ncbi:DUF3857 domain-containing protein [Bacteroides oleiciplenus]|uniref:DUF3857 domain-containing protein n=1 Tax=Bacteroides oleiciplenus TaxID=626931 RepID=A0A3E5B2S0_9BACE|nr:DUF3857 domain-containing protein [Bacteroides oleiciplenus]RGN31803.1 DUF3857 domain-containing protein [Bacteroides oleiciplenus]
MKNKLLLFCVFSLLYLPAVFSQQAAAVIKPDLKYGRPSKEELSLTTYTPDTTATAIYLFHKGVSGFTYDDGFQLVTEHWVRIKVLKPQGVSYADVAIPYYAPADRNKEKDQVFDLDGCSYNMEDGKIVKSRLKRDFVSNERVNSYYKVLKFSLPAVKVGTVIEYHYKVTSDYSVHIENWMMQEELPVIYNQYKITIPHVFVYNIEFRGRQYIDVVEEKSSMQAKQHTENGVSKISHNFTISARKLTFTSENLSAIRQDESYCWCPGDYKIQISFDLQGTNYPGEDYKPYSVEWGDVGKRLTRQENENFGKHLMWKNLYVEEIRQFNNSGELDFNKKVIKTFQLLKQKMSWNGEYKLYSENLDKVMEKGSGSNADLNFIFINMLRTYGIKAYPVVMSRRSLGMLPYNFPSLQKLNTFVVAVYDAAKNKYVYLDSSMDIPALDVLPLELSVSKARILSADVPENKKWVNLQDISLNQATMLITATAQDNRITGHRTTILKGHQALEYRKEHLQQDSLGNRQEQLKEKLTVSNLKLTDTDDDFTTIKEDFDFVLESDQVDNRIYINPLLFPQLTKNPFIQSERILPVEFSYPYKVKLMCTLTLPEGYEVEEIPHTRTVKTEDNKLLCRYAIQRNGNTVVVNYSFSLDSSILPSEHYKQLQEIWHNAVEMNQSLIVLKKLSL